jgi:hypothetical protein
MQLLEPAPQAYGLITLAELPPLGTLSLPGDPAVEQGPLRLPLRGGGREQQLVSLACEFRLYIHRRTFPSSLSVQCGTGPWSGRNRVLARTSAWPLARDNLAAHEQLATPDAPWLSAGDCSGKADHPYRAAPAERLRKFDILW